jgi:hypothetical protein
MTGNVSRCSLATRPLQRCALGFTYRRCLLPKVGSIFVSFRDSCEKVLLGEWPQAAWHDGRKVTIRHPFAVIKYGGAVFYQKTVKQKNETGPNFFAKFERKVYRDSVELRSRSSTKGGGLACPPAKRTVPGPHFAEVNCSVMGERALGRGCMLRYPPPPSAA